ncbi:hypothetical protein [Micromonospora sp. DT47]|uniref:hypothetical protein n=1 Tax=Micromonospora sp. DT47 TaxID=3393431 RepID=UPI003CFB650E
MTGREFREVDHDLLADYAGGALDGTPDQATVAHLVDADPAWADAYVALAPAVARVRDDLAGWGEPAPEMPLAVVERLTAALAGAGPAAPADAATPADPPVDHLATGSDGVGPAVPGVPAQAGSTARRTGASRPGEARAAPTGPGRRRRRWTRFAGPVALAAASLAAVGLGVGQLVDRTGDGTADSTVAEPAASDAAGAAAPFRFTGEPRHSGTDWTPETLAGARAVTALPRAATAAPGLQPGDGPTESAGKRQAMADGLDRLVDRPALDACLTEISAEHGRGAVTVELVDYASFRGEPALVVRFADPAGERWAWVSGAGCGVPGSGADTRYQARVG